MIKLLILIAGMGLSACGGPDSKDTPQPTLSTSGPASPPNPGTPPAHPTPKDAQETSNSSQIRTEGASETSTGTEVNSSFDSDTSTQTVTETDTSTATQTGTSVTENELSTTTPDCRWYAFSLTQTTSVAAPNPTEALIATQSQASLVHQIWCKRDYLELNQTLYYMIAYPLSAEVSPIPELARLVRRDSSGNPVSLTRARRYQSRLEVFEGPYDSSWLPSRFESMTKTEPNANWISYAIRHAEQNYATLTNSAGKSLATPVTIKSGTMTARVSEASLPWRGHWWPWRYPGSYDRTVIPIMDGLESPLQKYERFYKGQTGKASVATDWEYDHHHARDPIFKRDATGALTQPREEIEQEWRGHCNGWTAASQLYAEPRTTVRDPVTGIRFSPNDQKALLTEASFAVYIQFLGERFERHAYPDGRKRDPKDIHPHVFFKAIVESIGYEGRPIVMDYDATEAVNNHTVIGYNATISKAQDSVNTFDVAMTVSVLPYDEMLEEALGAPTPYTMTYGFTLVTDDTGRPIGGEWKTANPDFLWIPLGPMEEGAMNSKNPSERLTRTNENPWVFDWVVHKILRLPTS